MSIEITLELPSGKSMPMTVHNKVFGEPSAVLCVKEHIDIEGDGIYIVYKREYKEKHVIMKAWKVIIRNGYISESSVHDLYQKDLIASSLSKAC